MRKTLLLLSLLALASLATAAGVQATGAERTDLALVHTDFTTGEPERAWVEDGTLHVRGLPYRFGRVFGTLVGVQTGVFNFDVDLATGDGHGFGEFTIETTAKSVTSGTFAGRFSGQMRGGVFCGRFGGPGSGGFEGYVLRGEFCETGPETDTYETTGWLLDTGNDPGHLGEGRPKKKK